MNNLPHLYAYIDPATTTYLIQIVSALVITLSVTVGVFFKRMHMSLLSLRVIISEWRIRLFSRKKSNHNKKTDYVSVGNKAIITNRWEFLWYDDRNWKSRLKLELFPIISLVFTFMLFGVFEIYALNQDSFMFPIRATAGTLLFYAFIAFLILSLLGVLLKGRVFDAYVSLCFALLLAGYIQGNFLNHSLGELTGDDIAWDAMRIPFIVNTFLWLVFLLIPFLLRYFKKKLWNIALRALSLLLVLVQLISAISLLSSGTTSNYDSYLSSKGIYKVASEKNIVVIVLDRLDNRYIENVLNEDPHFFDPLDGFTRFTNNLSTYSQTFPSVANMLTGKVYDYDFSKKEFLAEIWKNADFLEHLKEEGFKIRLDVESSSIANRAEDLSKLADNVELSDIEIQSDAVWRQFMLLSGLRYAPLTMKPFFWTSTDRLNNLLDLSQSASPYITDDPEYYRQLCTEGLSKDNMYKKQFAYLHLNGPHAPYTMNEKAQEVEKGNSNSTIQTKGSFHIVYEYLSQLRKLGLYENSTIIITGDHGARKNDTEALDRAIVTALFVKPSGSAQIPLKLSTAPVSTDNLRPFIYQEAGITQTQSGPSYFEVSSDDQTPRILRHRLVGKFGQNNRVLRYEVIGDANDFNNWRLVDEHDSVY